MNNSCLILKSCLVVTLLVLLSGCADKTGASGEIENIIRRYNYLVIQGYRNQDMNPLQEVTTEEQARKLYHHMAALGEGKLRMESKLKDIKFKSIDQRSSAEATVETEETWDFTHHRMANNEKYAEEKDFIYRMGYILNKKDGRWVITHVNTISGTSTNTVIPWPVPERKSKKGNLTQSSDKPANHP
jgi:hypothetical protein